MLRDHLDGKDVGNLRLASPAFRQLPQTYFKHLILREMPWVWEARSAADSTEGVMGWYTLRLALCSADGGARKDEEERTWLAKVRRAAYTRVQDGLKKQGFEWGKPEYFKTFNERGPNYDEQAEKEISEAYASGRWPRRSAMEIKGLRDRRRVWEAVERDFETDRGEE